MSDHHDQSPHQHTPHAHVDSEQTQPIEFIDLLDLDGEVLHGYWSAALSWVQAATQGTARTRLLDLGAGSGTATIGLAQRCPAAEVIAVDISAASLDRLRARAHALGLDARVRTVVADLDQGWPDLGALDLTWASMSLHHLADPTSALRKLRAITRPGGLVAVAEFSQALRFLPDDLDVGRPGFEDRVMDALGTVHHETMPSIGSAWDSRLAEAGWTVTDEQQFTIDLRGPMHPNASRYAHAWYSRLSHGLRDQLDEEDQTTLDTLLADGTHSLLTRSDLHIRGSRTITVGRR